MVMIQKSMQYVMKKPLLLTDFIEQTTKRLCAEGPRAEFDFLCLQIQTRYDGPNCFFRVIDMID